MSFNRLSIRSGPRKLRLRSFSVPRRTNGSADSGNCIRLAVTGKFGKVTLTIDRPKLTPEDEKKLTQAQRNKKTSE